MSPKTTRKNADLPAHPISSGPDRSGHVYTFYGLTKREAFAKAAMQGLCANSIPGSQRSFSFLASEAVEYADALLSALEGDGE